MPALSTIRKRYSFVAIVPGYIKPIIEYLSFLKQQPNWTPNDALCSITYDEVHLSNLAQFDTKLGRCVGPHKCALLLMVRGLVSKRNWQYPLYTNFDYAIDKKDYLELVTKLYEMEFKVKLSVCDMGSKNISLANENNFNISEQNQSINQSIFYFIYRYAISTSKTPNFTFSLRPTIKKLRNKRGTNNFCISLRKILYFVCCLIKIFTCKTYFDYLYDVIKESVLFWSRSVFSISISVQNVTKGVGTLGYKSNMVKLFGR